MFITDEQIKELENLAPEHADTLIAFGGDMYRKGMKAGWLATMVGYVTGLTIVIVHDVIKNK